MDWTYTAALVLCIAASFYLGKRFSDSYHRQESENLKYALQKQYLRLQAGSDADDPAAPYVAPRQVVSNEFFRRLKRRGRAVERIS